MMVLRKYVGSIIVIDYKIIEVTEEVLELIPYITKC